jgi:hypothetical protein
MASVVKFGADKSQMAALQKARDEGGERAVVAVLDSHNFKGKHMGVHCCKRVCPPIWCMWAY